MSAATLCPNPDVSCRFCRQGYAAEHEHAEVWPHTYHSCGCRYIATDTRDGSDVCCGCGEARDLFGEFALVMTGGRR